jgi:DNA-binding LacI/PurR family transcriptional regulator
MSKTPGKPRQVIRSTADFARFVGLARTTVSRVLNGQPGLKQKTIARVERAMEETGFTPNAYALHLKGKRTAMVGICIESLVTPPAVLKLARLQQRLRERNYASLIEVVEPGGSRRTVRHFLSLRVDAIAFMGHFVEEEIAQRIRELRASGTPHVIVDQVGIPGANSVALDRVGAMERVFDHLLALGHRSFGLIGFSGSARSIRDRLAGIENALRAKGLSSEEATRSLDYLHVRDKDLAFGHGVAASFLAQPAPPTAFVALNDEIAIGALQACRAAGRRVPEDISVIGFNNQDICEMTQPALTSLDQKIDETVDAAADLLLSQIGAPQRTRPIARSIEPLLVIRQSTGPAR